MTTRRQMLLATGAAGVVLALGGKGAFAADAATAFIDDLGGRAIAVLADDSLSADQREADFRDLFLTAFDVPAIGAFVLGRWRRSATPEQIEEFNRLYTIDVVKTYSRRLSQYAGEQLQTLGSQPQGDNTLVHSQIVSPKGGAPVVVDWLLSGNPGSYQIVDVVIENLSMRNAQREDFSSVIGNGGMDALLAGLKKKNGVS
ncbi:ABC transporter substrate-binding protein [Zavarzinia compransoris]|uniref:MlaC/ttg2D family ABC transporter substrate-binding protein n=1 Tax=Zavarzinia marina TaxID=2911065 RepID=UPI001F1953D5|nr:ABC transporter substrate-binding protein [Zavarzinia marina]MCF4166955.1 ABC transporter substrate-binding protein [Zavarzinia marina]